VRAAIRALIMANEFLEMELSEVYAVVSRGYTAKETASSQFAWIHHSFVSRGGFPLKESCEILAT
jgi:hypothetical protein